MTRYFRLYHSHRGVRVYDIADEHGIRIAYTYHHTDATIFTSGNPIHDDLFMEVTKEGTRQVEFTNKKS